MQHDFKDTHTYVMNTHFYTWAQRTHTHTHAHMQKKPYQNRISNGYNSYQRHTVWTIKLGHHNCLF